MPFNVVVLGTSISWGQGLNPEEKYAEILRCNLEAARGESVTVGNYAHSGAKLWKTPEPGGLVKNLLRDHSPSSIADCAEMANRAVLQRSPSRQGREDLGECPAEEPYIWLQALRAVDDFAERSVDLVTLDAGANDLNFLDAISGKPRSVYFRNQLAKVNHLQGSIARLITALRRERPFRDSRFIITGYYRAFSSRSKESNVRGALRIARYLFGTLLDSEDLQTHLNDASTCSEKWVTRLHQVLSDDVEEANIAAGATKAGTEVVAFADPSLPASGALFADDPMIWLLDEDLGPNDHATQRRIGRGGCCEHMTTADLLVCQRAACGHPRPELAQLYAASIFHEATQLHLT